MRHFSALCVVTLTIVGCKTPYVEPLASVPLVPQSDEQLSVDNLLVLVDASGSISRRTLFPHQKALVESFVGSLPDGEYRSGQIVFGGYERQVVSVESFDRERMNRGAGEAKFLDESTQLDRVLLEAREALVERPGRTAVVIFSDGRPTAPGGWLPVPGETLQAARTLAESRNGEVCFYAVQTSDDAEGASFLRRLTAVTDCGAFGRSGELKDIASLHAFQRKILIGEGLPAVAAAGFTVSDLDGDGIPDADDLCPGTFAGAEVLSDGCWLPRPVYFGFDSAEIDDHFERNLMAMAEVLRRNPDAKLRIDGYTDSTGDVAYNQLLSERRAKAVQDFIVARGVSQERIGVKGFGEGNPPYPNVSRENRAANRRIEFAITK
jgi:OOP family OmpA-OmpF porin